MRLKSVFLAFFAVIITVSFAQESLGQSVEEWRATEEGEDIPKETVDQNYEGVTPGSGNTLPRVEELRGKPGTWVTWPGFIMSLPGPPLSNPSVRASSMIRYRRQGGR